MLCYLFIAIPHISPLIFIKIYDFGCVLKPENPSISLSVYFVKVIDCGGISLFQNMFTGEKKDKIYFTQFHLVTYSPNKCIIRYLKRKK